MSAIRTQTASVTSNVSGNRTSGTLHSSGNTWIRFWHGLCLCDSVMKKTIETTTSRKGSVMLEYVIVLCGLGVGLIVFMNRAFYSIGDGFGPMGQKIVAFYQRALGGLSLPVP